MSPRRLERRFSWSVSRDRLFRHCRRAYYYHYYGAWGGWEPDAPPAARELYVLRHLCTRHQWVGASVHAVLEAVLVGLREGRPVRADEAGETLTRLMRHRFEASRHGAYWRVPKGGGLVEHEYGLTVPREEWRRLHDEASRALAAAFTLGVLDRLARLPRAAWLAVERRDAFDLDGVQVWCVPDLAFQEGERVVVVDWKTGPPETLDAGGVRFQLACYALHATLRLGATVEGLRVGVGFLGGPLYQETGVTRGELDGALARVRASMLEMRSLLADPGTDLAREEDFPRTSNEADCAACPFRRPCRGATWALPDA